MRTVGIPLTKENPYSNPNALDSANPNHDHDIDDFEIIVDKKIVSKTEMLIHDLCQLPLPERTVIIMKVNSERDRIVAEYKNNFKTNSKAFQAASVINIALPILTVLYSGPLAAISSKVILEVGEKIWMYVPKMRNLEYVSPRRVTDEILFREMKEHQLGVAQQIFQEIKEDFPKPKEAEHVFKNLFEKYQIDVSNKYENSEIKFKIIRAFEIFQNYELFETESEKSTS